MLSQDSQSFQASYTYPHLEEVITYCPEALTLRPPGHPDRSSSLNDLAIAVLTRYHQLGRIEDLEEAITYLREALTLSPLGHPDRSSSLNNLAIAVLARHHQLGRIEDLEEAITYYREALTLCPPGHPDRSSFLNNLAIAALDHPSFTYGVVGSEFRSAIEVIAIVFVTIVGLTCEAKDHPGLVCPFIVHSFILFSVNPLAFFFILF